MPKLYSQSPNDHPYLSCCPERDKIWSLPRTTALHGLPRLMEPGARGGGIIASFPRDSRLPGRGTLPLTV
jgi:hypothetical protein